MSKKAVDKAVGVGGPEGARTDLPATPDFDSEEFPECFTCCICLDLLYKPVLLNCGHMSCFWCVHKSMSGLRESRCPVCRNPYIHFPSICPMLHFLLFKMYPGTYAKREKQIQEEEMKIRISSPQLDALLWRSLRTEPPSGSNLSRSSPTSQGSNVRQSPNGDSLPSTGLILADSEGSAQADGINYTQVLNEGSQSRDLPENELTESQSKSSITDVLCGVCKELLFRPVALNCGHVFCKCCIPETVSEKFECPVCHCPHPRGSPKVCLALDHFLEEEFSEDYALRKSAAPPEGISPRNQSPKAGDTDREDSSWLTADLKTHFGVGCDYCGMYPIVGNRYKCLDCEEFIGFDLCGDCYNSCCKLPGRFNQQHKPEHKFKLMTPYAMQRLMTRFLSARTPADGSTNNAFPPAENAMTSHVSEDTGEEDDEDEEDEDVFIISFVDDEEDEPPQV